METYAVQQENCSVTSSAMGQKRNGMRSPTHDRRWPHYSATSLSPYCLDRPEVQSNQIAFLSCWRIRGIFLAPEPERFLRRPVGIAEQHAQSGQTPIPFDSSPLFDALPRIGEKELVPRRETGLIGSMRVSTRSDQAHAAAFPARACNGRLS